MLGPELTVCGVTFQTLQAAITDLYFRYKGMTQEEFDEARKLVVPMQHNYMSPILPDGPDTVIQYWINRDDRVTHDFKMYNIDSTLKEAHVTLRFIGKRAEIWAKAFHHLTKRKHVAEIFLAYCNAQLLPDIGPIMATNLNYFNTGNAGTAFVLSFTLAYDEIIDYSQGSGGDRLEYISFTSGILDREGLDQV